MHEEQKTLLTDYDLHLLMEGTHLRAWTKLGAHPCKSNGRNGTWFAVWAPNAESVSVIGDFNNWDETKNPLACRGDSGIWEGFITGVGHGYLYKYAITSRYNGYKVQKADPYGFFFEIRPNTASVVWDISNYSWSDGEWMATRRGKNNLNSPISIYEVHLGSWMRVPEEGNRWLTYREIAPKLALYAKEMNFTHIEFLPVTEHPLDASWGYQTIGYFAATSRFGTPQDFMYLVDHLHQNDIGVILDWVPAHFPTDAHGLCFFDGTHLYEHEDPRKREHKDWGTYIFNYGRHEVANFLLANALFWLEVYHIDGLRVDAVASMLYLDYSRNEGEWVPNIYGGRENLEAIAFLRHLNETIYKEHPDTMTIAEESTAWPMVSRPTYLGGLGFGFKWNMGWMHDMLLYMSKDPIHRKYHHNNLTFSLLYAFHENFILPFSHDEVVHGKGSMIGKMPGDEWQKFANLRLLYGYMYMHPGKKLLFMGNEFGQWAEWNFETSLDWHLLQYPPHKGLRKWVMDLNWFLKTTPAIYDLDFEPAGFEWIDCNDSNQSIVSFIRRARNGDMIACVFNFTPVPRHNYVIGVPCGGHWRETINSDRETYWGSGQGNPGHITAHPIPAHGKNYSVEITIPPLGMVALSPDTD
ncbi:1,4-alpha-glucan branching protein GlgB [Dissulfurimicrobium hydrothermale]|uniref:1,4-alpha-glucan branching protein GlgB n=1 Tax=Dissulfurimicrobium hydrothermale TaxID=1750598 RepID=UPI001EDA6E6A|nr:1,4-alpha-glucan branching protein GlgB [Dissulfurimicrobium hydrothermale]UKL13412.1 1,4-alpha-glucan branching protein GlgB [Dissulfurimicrobium hydrothermale]